MEDRDPALSLLATSRTASHLYGVWAIVYGILTFIFGDALWQSRAYDLAHKIPVAPESWGAVLSIFGIMILYGQFRSKWTISSLGCWLTGVWCYLFAIFFLIDAIRRGEAFGLTGTWIYLILGTLMINRGALSRKVHV